LHRAREHIALWGMIADIEDFVEILELLLAAQDLKNL
jgi:hypothetical protein